MFSILGLITGLGPTILALGNKLADLVQARQQAKTNEELAKINAQIEEVHDKRAVLVAEAGSRINALVRFIAALGPIAYLTKIFMWDKVGGAIAGCAKQSTDFCSRVFTTDPLDDNLWWVVIAVVGFYFLVSGKSNPKEQSH